ncbi:hypothetical protein [Ostreiculturibacter nitratireducens]|uniref:DUF1127 domain-containing protein n=1 Tax=Ostreiculturibacter nitratireducens TaxID=3075226 RepID=UPI0031B64B2D
MEWTLVSRSFRGFHPFRFIRLMSEAGRQRRDLARLDGRLLDDVGVDESAARAEAKRPVWDVPQTWLR